MPSDSHPALYSLILQKIQQTPQSRITFAEYMDLVLYHPEYGYYNNRALQIGTQGDFYTAPHLGSDFSELLAEQFVEMWQLLGEPLPFTLLELGAGQGILSRDVLSYLYRVYPTLFAGLEYIIVEKSIALRRLQQQQLESLMSLGLNLQWRSLGEVEADSIVGCCFSNELVDAFPVHQVVLQSGQLQEVYVTLQSESSDLAEVVAELSTPQLQNYFERVGIDLTPPAYPDGYRTEVNLMALDWIAQMSDRLKQGYLLTIDYGYPAHRYYSPGRNQGTLQCYYQHRHHNDPYRWIGYQDLTAHVDFTALQNQGEHCGLKTLGLTQQGLFLMALGLGDRLAALSSDENLNLQTILQRREALHTLINPMGMGNFGVLIQAKKLPDQAIQQSLRGLRTQI